MCRNSLALQQTLSNITASREVALDQAKNFYDLLCMEPDVSVLFSFCIIVNILIKYITIQDILTSIIEKGAQFSEMQYLNALQLSCKARGIADSNTLACFQQKLSDILGAKPPTGVVV